MVLFFIFVILLLIPLIKQSNNFFIVIGLTFAIVVILVVEILTLYKIVTSFIASRELAKNSFNVFVEEIMANNNIGIIIYDASQKIIWSSTFIKTKFKGDFINWDIAEFFHKFHFPGSNNYKMDLNQSKIEFYDENSIFEAQFWQASNTVVIRDISTEYLFKTEADEQKIVIGEIEIDNYQLYQSILSEEHFFRINKIIIDTIEEYVRKYNLIYRQYTNGKFIIITNQKVLDNLKEQKFDLFVNLNQKATAIAGVINKLSVSAGFATGWSSLAEQLEQAKKALLQAQSRGGDQIAIFSNNNTPLYYGSNSEIIPDTNRTKVKNIALELQQKLESKEIDKVIIYGHSLADLDAIGASYGIYELAKQYGKEVYIGNNTFDNTAISIFGDFYLDKKELKEAYSIKNMQYLTKITDGNTLVVFVDNSDIMRTDNPDALINSNRNNIFIIDHHRIYKEIDYCPRSNIYIETSASSASEIVTEILAFIQTGKEISRVAAQLLLNGIYLDTNQFSKSISSRTFEAAGFLESKGARGEISGELLKIDEKTKETIAKLLSNLTEVKPGFFLTYSDVEASNDTISIAANEVLKIKGRLASFVVAKLKDAKNPNTYKVSARGNNTNVQIICESIGGGGHFGVAAAVSTEPLEVFVDNIKHAIVATGDK